VAALKIGISNDVAGRFHLLQRGLRVPGIHVSMERIV